MNTPQQFDKIAKLLHWSMALIIIIAWVSVEYRQRFTEPRTSENLLALDTHLLAGISIGLLILPRLVWRQTHRAPPPPPGSKLEHTLANFSHFALYAFMIAMPLTGYLGTGRDINVFGLFSIPQFQNTGIFRVLILEGIGLSFEEWEKPIDYMHKNIGGKWLLPILFILHVSAALFHHYVRKDDVLKRMLPDFQKATDLD